VTFPTIFNKGKTNSTRKSLYIWYVYIQLYLRACSVSLAPPLFLRKPFIPRENSTISAPLRVAMPHNFTSWNYIVDENTATITFVYGRPGKHAKVYTVYDGRAILYRVHCHVLAIFMQKTKNTVLVSVCIIL
jgi:hypothetical protein